MESVNISMIESVEIPSLSFAMTCKICFINVELVYAIKQTYALIDNCGKIHLYFKFSYDELRVG